MEKAAKVKIEELLPLNVYVCVSLLLRITRLLLLLKCMENNHTFCRPIIMTKTVIRPVSQDAYASADDRKVVKSIVEDLIGTCSSLRAVI